MLVDELDEVLDLVDADDKIIGTIHRRQTHGPARASMKGYIRVAEAFLINDQGQLWVPTRTTHKAVAPGGLDFACAEHVGSGESYLGAMVRGFQEELNLVIEAADVKLLGIVKPDATPVFRATYLYRSNDEPNYNREDYMSAEWMTAAELRRRIKAGEPNKNTVLTGLDLLEKYLTPGAT